VAEAGGFDLNCFAESWQNLFKGYSGYFDKATKTTLDNFGSGSGPETSGSNSTDLGGASRISPLVYALKGDLDSLVTAVRDQTAMTHNHPEVVDSAEFFARSALKVLNGAPPVEALGQVVDEHFNKNPYDRWVTDGVESAAKDSRIAIAGFGQMCETGAAFPSVVHLIAKHQDDLEKALIENVMAGGDSAARGMILGMILGAFHGYDGIPDEWYLKMKKHDIIVQLLEQIDRSNN
jgi:ADP-ribosylglycohydrolase